MTTETDNPSIDTRSLLSAIATAMAEQRWDEVLARLDADVIAHVPGSGDLVGIDAVAGFVLETGAKTDDGEHLEVLDVLVGEEFAAVYFRVTARRQGREPLDNLTLHLARFTGGRVSEIWFHNFDGRAVEEFWA